MDHNTERINAIAELPLVSFDLVIRNRNDELLLGFRKNEPAKHSWFVLGGSIDKGEDLDKAFERIAAKELEIMIPRAEANFLGIFYHDYPTNYMEVPGITTEYVVIAYEIIGLDELDLKKLPPGQHEKYDWFSKAKAEKNDLVHPNVKIYFDLHSKMLENQYEILNARRDSYNSLLWQTPVLSLTAQAFLFVIILSKNIIDNGRIIAALLSIFVAFASFQLMRKHRYYEVEHSEVLRRIETARGFRRINEKSIPKITWNPLSIIDWVPSSIIWEILMLSFGLAAFISILPSLVKICIKLFINYIL